MEETTGHEIVTQMARPLTIKDQSCFRMDTVMEDHDAVKRTSRTDYMIIDDFAVFCRHPNASMGILVSYSHRHYPENKDPGAAGKAQKVFDSIEFSELSVETRVVGH